MGGNDERHEDQGVALTQAHDDEFARRLDVLHADAVACARHGFAELAINVVASRDDRIRERVREDAGYWQTTMSALQSSAFVSLGRVFDGRKGTITPARVLDYVATYPGIFSRGSLRARKARESPGMDISLLDPLIDAAFEPTAASFAAIRTELDERAQYFEDHVEEIRNSVFAHATGRTRAEVDALFLNVKVREYEKLLVFPIRLHDALSNLFTNGTKPELRPAPTLIQDVLAEAKVASRTVRWEHVEAVTDVLKFMQARLG